jgi:putative hydrolase of the HAD superfamily
MKPLPAAILFDLDDTILSLSRTAAPAWQALCSRFADRLQGADPDALLQGLKEAGERFWKDERRQRRYGRDVEQARRRIAAEGFRLAGLDDVQTAHEMADTFSRERVSTIVPFPGALETLELLRERFVRLALVTNGRSRTQREKIEHFSLEPYFDCIVVEEEFGVGKPNPRVFRHALASIGASAEDAWMVGDNLAFDIAGAQQLGIHAIWHDVHGVGLAEGSSVRPDRIIRELGELLADEPAA